MMGADGGWAMPWADQEKDWHSSREVAYRFSQNPHMIFFNSLKTIRFCLKLTKSCLMCRLCMKVNSGC